MTRPEASYEALRRALLLEQFAPPPARPGPVRQASPEQLLELVDAIAPEPHGRPLRVAG